MIRKSFYIGALALMAAALPGCNDSASDLLETKLYFEENVINVNAEEDTYVCDITSRISKPTNGTVKVNYAVGGQDLVDKYNAKYGVTAQLFPAENYAFLSNESVVKPGSVYSEACQLQLNNIMQGEDGVTYVLPLLISTNDVSTISSSSVAYVVIKKPIRIYKAMQFGTYWLDVRLPASFKSTTSVTYEALVYATSWRMLGTIMGNEGVLIMRTGDLNHPANELQMAGNVQMQMSNCDAWTTGKWYHVAFTYDAASGKAELYLNGESINSKNVGAVSFDLNNRFTVGYAYDYDSSRKWYGYMSEVRLWSVARTANQIKENMMYVNPDSEGLEGYWKLNGEDIEERDGVWYVLDQTSHHYDATSNRGRRGENGGSQTFGNPTMADVDVRL